MNNGHLSSHWYQNCPAAKRGAAGRGGRGAEWKGDMPPVPDYYIHQLLSLPPERMVDGDKLAEEMNKLLQ